MGYMEADILKQGAWLCGQKYRIQGLCYRGSSCVLYFAEENRNNRQIIIKEFYPEGFAKRGGDKKSVFYTANGSKTGEENYNRLKRAFLEECRITKLLQGKEGFVQFMESFEENGTGYLVLEKIEGQNYLDFMQECRLKHDIPAIRDCLCQICERVAWLHSKKILHRDIKPSNFLITEEGTAVMLDFGNAACLTEQAEPVYSISERYAPPEFYQNKTGSRCSDIYSLGILICQSLPEEETGVILRMLILKALRPNPCLRLSKAGWIQKAIAWNM